MVTACARFWALRNADGCASGPPLEVLLHSQPDPRWGGAQGAPEPLDPAPYLPLLATYRGESSRFPGGQSPAAASKPPHCLEIKRCSLGSMATPSAWLPGAQELCGAGHWLGTLRDSTERDWHHESRPHSFTWPRAPACPTALTSPVRSHWQLGAGMLQSLRWHPVPGGFPPGKGVGRAPRPTVELMS